LLPSTRKVILRSAALAAGLLAFIGPAVPDSRPAGAAIEPSDPRQIRIRQYFRERNCPAHELAEDFILAADEHDLDWRLLPSICMVETTGGKAAVHNNMFGWNCGRARFNSPREGLYVVAERLANARWYRQKPLDRLLRTYNPVPGYSRRVLMVMRTLGPAQIPLAAAE
jgi:hypothetical protein